MRCVNHKVNFALKKILPGLLSFSQSILLSPKPREPTTLQETLCIFLLKESLVFVCSWEEKKSYKKKKTVFKCIGFSYSIPLIKHASFSLFIHVSLLCNFKFFQKKKLLTQDIHSFSLRIQFLRIWWEWGVRNLREYYIGIDLILLILIS